MEDDGRSFHGSVRMSLIMSIGISEKMADVAHLANISENEMTEVNM